MSAPSRLVFACALALALPVAAQNLAPAAPPGVTPTGAQPSAAPTPQTGSKTGLTSPSADAQKKIADAMKFMNTGDVDGALNALTQAITLNPNSSSAYVLRASIYTQRHQWAAADADFRTAQKLAPTNSVLKFQTVELKFLQKQYDAARSGFLPLETDPEMGDYAMYKVFLCDLYGNHPPMAKHELDVFNAAMGNPSYYFANAAWDLYYKKVDDARDWLTSAGHIYPYQKFILYGQPLRDLGYLPIPEPAGATVKK